MDSTAGAQFRWLGVAGIELRTRDHVLVIDPFLTRFEPWRALGRVRPNGALVAQAVRQCDFVLVSHAHWDHLMDVPEVVRSTGAVAFGSANTCRLLSACGVPASHIRQIRAGDRLGLGGFQVEVLPAEHLTLLGRPVMRGRLRRRLRPPLRPWHYRMDQSYSFLIEVAGQRVLDWCSELAEGAPRADYLLMRPYATPAACERLLNDVRPRVVVPVHWDSFVRPLSRPLRPMLDPRPRRKRLLPGRVDLVEFARMAEAALPGVTVWVPPLLATYAL